MFCEQVATELDIIMSHDPRAGLSFMEQRTNMPLFPISSASYPAWARRSEDKIREALRTKHAVNFANKLAQGKGKQSQRPVGDDMV